MSRIIVVGSSNVDLTAKMQTLPRPGETLRVSSFLQTNGGKGANQAVAAGRLGADVAFLTCVGNDSYGKQLKAQFEKDGIDTSAMKSVDGVPTGTALIFVDEKAENCIAVVPGANDELKPEDIDSAKELISKADYLVLQLEIPIETVERSIALASAAGVKVILDPAPMREFSPEAYKGLYLITPNATEAEKLTGVKVEDADGAKTAAQKLMAMGVANVIVTLGSKGSFVCTASGSTFVPALKVDAVDTTAAGDVFNGALVTALSEGKTLEQAAEFATKASAVSVTRPGAQISAPFRNEI